MSETAIRVEHLGKKFLLGHRRSDDLRGTFGALLAKFVRRSSAGKEAFWALKDINFEVKRGEVVGIIGRNGAGKSTLLKILSRITHPTTGKFEIAGRVSSLLEVGTGFHSELTGRENIFLNGTILGMKRAEIKKKFDEIVSFSGVENFLDTPVKHYSSGMRVRLAFSVAAHLEPEILIIDEVLAVGDAEFQKKCLGKMNEVSRNEGRTVLFVSHNMAAVELLCTHGIFMYDGRVLHQGDVSSCIAEYQSRVDTKSVGNVWKKREPELGKKMEILSCSAEVDGQQSNLKLTVRTDLKSNKNHKDVFISYDVAYQDGSPIFQAIPTEKPFIQFCEDIQTVTSVIELPSLIPGDFKISIWIGPHYAETYDWQLEVLTFRVETSPVAGRTYPHSKRNGFFVPSSTIVHEVVMK